MSIRQASIKYGIPITYVRAWMMGVTSTIVRGPHTILSREEEIEVVQWCKDMVEIGHGLQINQLQSTIAQISGNMPNPFRNGILVRSRWASFRWRHPNLTMRTT